MSLSGSQRYNFEELRDHINNALLNEQMPDKLYKSVDGFLRIINAIVITKGDNWAAQVLDENGKPLLTPEEQAKFTDVFKPYIDDIINFFSSDKNDDEMVGGTTQYPLPIQSPGTVPMAVPIQSPGTVPMAVPIQSPGTMPMAVPVQSPGTMPMAVPVQSQYPPMAVPVQSPGTMPMAVPIQSQYPSMAVPIQSPGTKEQSVLTSIKSSMSGMGDIYSKIMERINKIDTRVNDYASRYGILKLEMDHDVEPDIGLPIPQPIIIPPPFTPITPVLTVLSKIKIPFRTIITTIYLILDITRLALGSSGSNKGRKILSILVALLELLRGDWKKAILTSIGFFGMTPMLAGQLVKVFLTVIRTLSPDIQISDIFNPLDIVKSFLVGLLLSIFQVTAPAIIRKPLIESLKKIAERKAQIDITLGKVNLPSRPDYLSPSWNDLNNIQAVIADKVYVCSCEFRELVSAVNNSTIIKVVLEILRIPVTEEMIQETCGMDKCDKFATLMVKEGQRLTMPSSEAQIPLAHSIQPSAAQGLPIYGVNPHSTPQAIPIALEQAQPAQPSYPPSYRRTINNSRPIRRNNSHVIAAPAVQPQPQPEQVQQSPLEPQTNIMIKGGSKLLGNRPVRRKRTPTSHISSNSI